MNDQLWRSLPQMPCIFNNPGGILKTKVNLEIQIGKINDLETQIGNIVNMETPLFIWKLELTKK